MSLNPTLLVLAGVAGLAMTVLYAEQPAAVRQETKPQAGISVPASQPTTQAAPLYTGRMPDEWKSYQELHGYVLDRFINSNGFGVSRMARVTEDPARLRKLYVDSMRYTIGPVQLISLNDAKTPFAYETPPGGNVKDMLKIKIKNAKHIELSKEEVDAVGQLWEGQEVVPVEISGKRTLIGAVRATASCIKCHEVQEGTLLGAFRYPLEREQAEAVVR